MLLELQKYGLTINISQVLPGNKSLRWSGTSEGTASVVSKGLRKERSSDTQRKIKTSE